MMYIDHFSHPFQLNSVKLEATHAAWGLPHTAERFGLTKVQDKWTWQSLLSSGSILKVFLTVDSPSVNSLWCHLAVAVVMATFVVGVNSCWAGEGPPSIPTYHGSHSSNERSLSHSTSVLECKKCRTWQRRVLVWWFPCFSWTYDFKAGEVFLGICASKSFSLHRLGGSLLPSNSCQGHVTVEPCGLLLFSHLSSFASGGKVPISWCLASCDYPLEFLWIWHDVVQWCFIGFLLKNLCLVALCSGICTWTNSRGTAGRYLPFSILLRFLLKRSCIKVHRIIAKLQVVKSGLPLGANPNSIRYWFYIICRSSQWIGMDMDGVSAAGDTWCSFAGNVFLGGGNCRRSHLEYLGISRQLWPSQLNEDGW